MRQTLFTCLWFVAVFHGVSFCQNNSIDRDPRPVREARGDSAIQAIKQGVLIVRLASGSKKIEELNKLAAAGGISEARQKRLQEMAQSTREETDRTNRLLVGEFARQFDFSKVLFLYDTAVQYLKDGVQSGIFLDTALQADPAIRLDGAPYCIAYFGREPNSPAGSKVEGLLTLDRDFQPLESPFPYFVSQVKYFLFFVERPVEKYFENLVYKYNKALHRYSKRD